MIDTGLDKGHPYSGAPYSLSKKLKGVDGDLPLITYTYGFTVEKKIEVEKKGKTVERIYRNRYLAHFEEYDHKVLILKFHHKDHSHSDKKYNIILNKGEGLRVLATVARIALEEFAIKDPAYSFGFIGAPREKQADPKRKRDAKMESRENTTRFQVWSKLAKRFFNPDNWLHASSPKESAYAIFKKEVHSPELEIKITEMFQKHYLDLFDQPNTNTDTASVG